MNNKEFIKIANIMSKGKERHIIRTMIFLTPMIAIQPLISYLFSKEIPSISLLMLNIVTWLVAGFLIGLMTWNILLRKYLKHKDKFENTNPPPQ